MSKLAMIADVHVEKNKNLPYVVSCCEWVGDELKQRNITELFVLGDFINSRIKIDSLALSSAIQILEYWTEKGINVYLLLGNHELYYRENRGDHTEVTSIRPFKKFCEVIEHYQAKEVYGTTIHFIPWITDLEKYKEVLKSIIYDENDIIMSHTEVRGSIMNSISSIKDTDGLPSSIFPVRTFLGHYHKRQRFYVGSPLSLNFGEASKDKGITIYDVEKRETEFIQNPKSELYKSISLDDFEDEAVDIGIENTKFVRILLTKKIDESYKSDIIHKFASIDKSVTFKPVYCESEEEVISTKDNSLTEIIEEYVDKYAEDLDKKRLLSIGKNFYERKYSNVL